MYRIYSKGNGKNPMPEWLECTPEVGPEPTFEAIMAHFLRWKADGQRVRVDWDGDTVIVTDPIRDAYDAGYLAARMEFDESGML